MKRIVLLLALGWSMAAGAQELYVFSEPASNMPAHTLTPRLVSLFNKEGGRLQQRYLPEVMAGLGHSIMIHGGMSFSNFTGNMRWEGAYLYGKYRFLSHDDVHEHFRMAAFAEGGYSRPGNESDELNLPGERSGVQLGLIATQLTGRAAVSATVAHTRALDKDRLRSYDYGKPFPYQSFDYSLSAGYLVLPKTYTSYQQLNLNIYMELLGQRTLDYKTFYTDLAPAVQLLFNSNSKLNLGYRFQLGGNGMRNMTNSFLLSFEHTFFNAIGK